MKATARLEREAQSPLALLTTAVLRSPMIGGAKDLQVDDLYTGLARLEPDVEPLPPGVLGGIFLAFDLGVMSTDALTLLSQAHPGIVRVINRDYEPRRVSGKRRATRRAAR